MTKINKEEYEILKGLDDKWKWIARDNNYDASLFCFKDRPYKSVKSRAWSPTVVQYEYLGRHDSKFQFIQWEDEEPYNIAELIEEYEEHEFYNYVGWEYHKSEEAEVKKNIKWLKEEVSKLRGYAVIIDGEGGEWEPVTTVSMEDIYELINQLDKLEVLSQEWIDKYVVHVRGLGDIIEAEAVKNLLVPTLSEVEADERTQLETAYRDILGRGEFWFDDKEYVVVEKPVIPKFIAEAIEKDKEDGYDVYDSIDLIIETNGGGLPSISNWVAGNIDKYARAWLYGFTVEKEQKYYLKIGNLYLAEPLGDMTSDIVRMTRDKGVAYQFTDEKSITTHLDKFEGARVVKVEGLE